MKKRILFLLLTIMTLLSNTVFGQTFDNPFGTYTINLVPTTTLTSVTDVLSITIDTDVNGLPLVDVLGQGNDSIIYEFDNYIGNINLSNIMNVTYNAGSATPENTCQYALYKTVGITTYAPIYTNSTNFITTYTTTLIFTATNTTYKIVNLYDGFGSNVTKLTFYVRNYHVIETLPSSVSVPFVTSFVSSITTYNNTSSKPNILTGLSSGWVQSLTTTVGSTCITSYGITDCDSTTILTVVNPDGDLTYTFTYNRPAQTPTDPTGVKEVKSVTSIVTYPNPCEDFIKVRFNTEQSVLPIELYNLQGQLLLQNNEKRKLGDNEIEFNTQKLSNGVYFIKNGAQTVKFIKE